MCSSSVEPPVDDRHEIVDLVERIVESQRNPDRTAPAGHDDVLARKVLDPSLAGKGERADRRAALRGGRSCTRDAPRGKPLGQVFAEREDVALDFADA